MIILTRKTNAGTPTSFGVPLHNLAEVSQHKDNADQCWIKHWNGTELRSTVVDETLESIQHKVFVARHGKLPAKGVLTTCQ